MKKSNLEIQSENAILMTIAMANGYLPMSSNNFKKELSKKIKESGIKSYKEAFNFAYATMPQYVGEDAIYCGKITLIKDDQFIDFSLGNNEQYVDDYTNIPKRIIAEYLAENENDQDTNVDDIIKNNHSMFNFLEGHVVPKLIRDREEIASGNISHNNPLQKMIQQDTIKTLFDDYKFPAFKNYEHCRGNKDATYYSLTHGMIDAVLDVYDSALKAFDEKDIDLRAISPNLSSSTYIQDDEYTRI